MAADNTPLRASDTLTDLNFNYSSSVFLEVCLRNALAKLYKESPAPLNIQRFYLINRKASKEDLPDLIKAVAPSNYLISDTTSTGDDTAYTSIEFLFEDNGSICNLLVEIGRSDDFVTANLTYYGPADCSKRTLARLYDAGFCTSDYEGTDVEVTFSYSSSTGCETTTRHFKPIPFDDIRKNYTKSVQDETDELLAKLQEVTNGIVVIHGLIGTGKTYLLRSILSELKGKRDGVICSPPTVYLGNIGLINSAVEGLDNPIVILEDLGELFHKKAKFSYADQFSTLANFSDGLLGLLRNAVFLLTFNYDEEELDEALIRPGRCISNFEIPRLSRVEAQAAFPDKAEWLTADTYSLAEIYALKDGQSVKKRKTRGNVGFVRKGNG